MPETREIPGKLKAGLPRIQFFTRAWNLPEPPEVSPRASLVIMDKEFFAPAVPLSFPKRSLPLYQLNSPDGAPEILPLSDIRLPQKAVGIDGLYPEDADYPLTREICLTLTPPEGYPLSEGLIQWLGGLYEPPAQPKREILVFTGPIIPSGSLQRRLLWSENPVETVLGDTQTLLGEGQITAAAFFGCITDQYRRLLTYPRGRCDQRVLPPLRKAGYDYWGTASLESLNHGPRGLEEHLGYLQSYGMETSGLRAGGEDRSEAALFRLPDHRISLLTLHAPFTHPETLISRYYRGEETLLRSSLSPLPDPNPREFQILFLQSSLPPNGADRSPALRTSMRRLAEKADLVMAHYPGPPGHMEVYQGTPLIYNLGSFLSGDPPRGQGSLILQLGLLEGKPLYWDFYPVKPLPGRVSRWEQGSSDIPAPVLQSFWAASGPWDISASVQDP